MKVETKTLIINLFLGGVSFLIDLINEISNVLFLIPSALILLCVGYFIYQPDVIAEINNNFIMEIFSFVHNELQSFILFFLAIAILTLFFRYLLGNKKFVLGCVLVDSFGKK